MKCDLCACETTTYRIVEDVRVFDDGALRDLAVCVACDPQLPEATQKQRRRAERAEMECVRLQAAEALLRESHRVTVAENASLRAQVDECAHHTEPFGLSRDDVAALIVEGNALRAEIAQLKEQK